MLVTALSGTTVAQLDEEEFLHMVESGKTIRDLKQLLSVQVRCSRFRQRLFSEEIELQDDMPLRPLPSIQMVILPFCAPDRELLLSCQTNNVIDVERLLQKPQDPNATPYGSYTTVLSTAAQSGHLEVARLLLDAGADKDAANNRTGQTALMVATDWDRLEVVRLLLDAGADKDAANNRTGATALMIATDLEVVRLLLDAGANKDAANQMTGATALMSAAEGGHVKVVRLLLEAGADRDAVNLRGATALMIAAEKGQTEVVQLLLEAGAGHRRNPSGNPLLDLSISLMERSWSQS